MRQMATRPASIVLASLIAKGHRESEIRQRFAGGTGPYPAFVENAERLCRATRQHGRRSAATVIFTITFVCQSKPPPGALSIPRALWRVQLRCGAISLSKPEITTDPAVQRRRIDILTNELGLDKQLVTRWAAGMFSSWGTIMVLMMAGRGRSSGHVAG